jgi:type VI secretion system secreted protein Hcp
MRKHTANRHHLATSTVLAFLLGGMLMSPAMGAVFAKYDGIDGESQDRDHKNWIEILSFGHSVFQEVSQIGGARNGSSRSSRTDFVMSKRLDKSSPLLAVACCTGEHIPEVTLELTANSVSRPLLFLRIKLTNVIVSSFNMGGTEGEDGPPVEEITLNYEKIEWTYFLYDDKGAKINETTTSWNFATGTGN